MQEVTLLERLHMDYTNNPEYGKSDVVKEMDKVYWDFLERLENIVPDKTIYSELEDTVDVLTFDRERQGFIMGFKYAVQIMTDCGIKTR